MDEKLSGVRAKIALFSSEKNKSQQVHGKSSLGKYQSSEDVGKLGVGAGGSLTRAHTHSDVRFDENGLKTSRQSMSQLSLKSLKAEERSSGSVKQNGVLHKSGSNLKPQNKSTSFRSMINVSSNQVRCIVSLLSRLNLTFMIHSMLL